MNNNEPDGLKMMQKKVAHSAMTVKALSTKHTIATVYMLWNIAFLWYYKYYL